MKVNQDLVLTWAMVAVLAIVLVKVGVFGF